MARGDWQRHDGGRQRADDGHASVEHVTAIATGTGDGQASEAAGRPYSAPELTGLQENQPPRASAQAATRRDLPDHHRRRPRSLTTLAGAAGIGSGLTMDFNRCAHSSNASASLPHIRASHRWRRCRLDGPASTSATLNGTTRNADRPERTTRRKSWLVQFGSVTAW